MDDPDAPPVEASFESHPHVVVKAAQQAVTAINHRGVHAQPGKNGGKLDRDVPAAGEQADWGQTLPFGLPDDINVTGAVPQQANLSDDPAPASKTPLVDLNTAPLSQLNALKGAGGLGRAIIRGRPYASAEDLAKKRVVRRNVYERIKDQITVR